MTEYVSRRDGRFDNAGEAIDHVEHHNCSLGCTVPGDTATRDEPGGSCPVLLRILTQEPTPELVDHADWVECTARKPETSETSPPPDTDTLF